MKKFGKTGTKKQKIIATALIVCFIFGFGAQSVPDTPKPTSSIIKQTNKNETIPTSEESETPVKHNHSSDASSNIPQTPTQATEPTQSDIDSENYQILNVDGGDRSGHREANVKVDIGFGDRTYWAYTNAYGQLVKVTADTIILQNDATEFVTSDGRYYSDEAKVPGVEQYDLDEGHIIADSLGGVSNAYNITPQNSMLNRHGDQAYMEKVIRDAGGCQNFTAIITYPNTETQIPSHYDYTYTVNGNTIHDSFANQNPEENTATQPNTNSDVQNVKPTQPQYTDNTIIYYTPNGKSYHSTPNCSTLSRSKTIIEGTLSESGKLDACDRCAK